MGLVQQLNSFEEYLDLRDNTKELYEYINGQIIKLWSPSTLHQTIVFKLGIELAAYFKNSKCKVMPSPYDVFLSDNKSKEKNVVIPDISVMCDKEGFDEKRYTGVPHIIVEVLSTNVENDLFRKFNLYLSYGVKEYWVIDPVNRSFQVHTYDFINKTYVTSNQSPYKELKSRLFDDLVIDMDDIFEEE